MPPLPLYNTTSTSFTFSPSSTNAEAEAEADFQKLLQKEQRERAKLDCHYDSFLREDPKIETRALKTHCKNMLTCCPNAYFQELFSISNLATLDNAMALISKKTHVLQKIIHTKILDTNAQSHLMTLVNSTKTWISNELLPVFLRFNEHNKHLFKGYLLAPL